jgi:uncharacterized protein (TIGR03435 family)
MSFCKVACFLAALAAALGAQPARPAFEVASIKPSQENRFMAVRALPGGRLAANAPVRLLIQNAYGLQSFQIAGGPAWVESDRFEIDAKATGGADRAQIMTMLQSLLEERFQLRSHRETRQLPVYELVAAKGGPKLPPAKAGDCSSADAPPPPGRGQPMAFPCGRVGIQGESSGARMEGRQVAMVEFLRMLAGLMGRAVLDKTGVTGTFDVHLKFAPDSTTAGLSAMAPPGAAPPADISPENPSIFSALQEQLGLKLESAKGPVEVLVIDHVERPSAN